MVIAILIQISTFFESDVAYPVFAVLCSLGRAMLECQSLLSREQKLRTLGAVWSIAQALPSVEHYLACAVVWAEFTARNFGPKEVGSLFGDIVKHAGGGGGANNASGRSATISKVGYERRS